MSIDYRAKVAAGICYTCRKAPASGDITKLGTPSGQCNPCRDERAETYKEVGRPRYFALKFAALAAYGSICACCGETDHIFLSIDHINDDGAEHRKQTGQGIDGLYRWLKDNQYPEGFRVLCHNCNHGRYLNGGICPHEQHAREVFGLAA